METESVIAIGIGLIALLACFGIYTMIPEAEANPITWTAITQYNDKITTIQNDIIQMKLDIKDSDFGYDNEKLEDIEDNLEESIDDLKDDIDDFDDRLDDLEDAPTPADGIDGLNGTTGATGADGADGTDGVDGIDGTDGQDGEDGADGADGDCSLMDIVCTTDCDYRHSCTTTCDFVTIQ